MHPLEREIKHRPKKSLGQNFLISPSVAKSIVDLAELDATDTVIEIGPGRGILTRLLAPHVKRLVALEFDPRLAEQLKKTFETQTHVEIIQVDALSYPFEKFPKPFKVVSNLPYHIATPLLFRFLKERDRISLMVLMFQRELARRMVASPGKKDYGSLSLTLQYLADVKLHLRVSRKSFYPNPKVESAVLTLCTRPSPPIHLANEELFFQIVRAVFQHRRKSIKNALKDAGFREPMVMDALLKNKLDPLRRPETLTLPEFGLLTDHLFFSRKKL